MERDMHNNVDDLVAMTQQAITTDTTTVGAIIDTFGFESLEFMVLMGTITDGVYALLLEESEDSGMSGATAVPAVLTLGALTGFILTDDDAVKRVGSIGKMRYQRLSIVSTGTTTGVNMAGAIAILGDSKRAPIAQ